MLQEHQIREDDRRRGFDDDRHAERDAGVVAARDQTARAARRRSTVSCALGMLEGGFTATRKTSSLPLVMPPLTRRCYLSRVPPHRPEDVVMRCPASERRRTRPRTRSP